jgi:hypothetical protein
MGKEIAVHHPGSRDINDQFSTKLQDSLTDYKALLASGAGYQFGELTAKVFNLTQSEHDHWKSSIGLYPPDVQAEIKRHVVAALTRTNAQGQDAPVPISFQWKPGPKSIACTYKPGTHPSYEIVITGFPEPMASTLSERRRAGYKSSD